MGWFRKRKKRETQANDPDAGNAAFWTLTKPTSPDAFFIAIGQLFAADAVLYMEGTSIAPDIHEFLSKRPAAHTRSIQLGTVWPKPSCHHMNLIPEYLAELTRLAEHYAEPEICDHLVVYSTDEMLLQWYDAWMGPIEVAQSVDRAGLTRFCHTIGSDFNG